MKLYEDERGIGHIAGFLLLAVLTIVGLVGWRVYDINLQESVKQQGNDFGPWEQRIADGVKSKNCTEVAPTFPSSYYQGPLTDTHFHPPNIPDSDPESGNSDYLGEKVFTSLGVNITMGDIVCMFNADGSTPKNILAFFPAFPSTHKYSVEVVRRTMQQYPGVFAPFLNPPGECKPGDMENCSQTVDAAKLDEILSLEPGLFKGYGEIGLYGHENGPEPLAPNAPRLQAIYPVLRKHGIKKVFFHLGEGQKAAFDEVLKANRDITFIFHGDQLVPKNDDGSQNLSQIDDLLYDNPNAYYGVDEFWMDTFLLHEKGSKEEVLKHLSDYGPLLEYDLANWKPFIERHPDQVLWDTDRGTYLWATDIEVGRALVKYARRFIAELDPFVQEKYAYKNAKRAYAAQSN